MQFSNVYIPSNTGKKSSGEIQVLFDFLRMLKNNEVSSNRFRLICIYPLMYAQFVQ